MDMTPNTVVLRFDGNAAGFIQEMTDRGPNVDAIVRITRRYEPSPKMLPLTHVSVIATYLRRADDGTLIVVRFSQYAGQVVPGNMGGVNDGPEQRADALIDELRAAASDLRLTTAVGVYDGGE